MALPVFINPFSNLSLYALGIFLVVRRHVRFDAHFTAVTKTIRPRPILVELGRSFKLMTLRAIFHVTACLYCPLL
jgi:hypothetical protein